MFENLDLCFSALDRAIGVSTNSSFAILRRHRRLQSACVALTGLAASICATGQPAPKQFFTGYIGPWRGWSTPSTLMEARCVEQLRGSIPIRVSQRWRRDAPRAVGCSFRRLKAEVTLLGSLNLTSLPNPSHSRGSDQAGPCHSGRKICIPPPKQGSYAD
jgi:hypothetical protein